MVFNQNENKAIETQIKFLSTLQEVGQPPMGFNKLKERTKIHPSIINKYLSHFLKRGCLDKVGKGIWKKYLLNEKGRAEYQRLLGLQYSNKELTRPELLDSMTIKSSNKNKKKQYNCEGVLTLSGILPIEKKEEITEVFNNEILPYIEKEYSEVTKALKLSGSALVTFRENNPKD